jgi:hypothetical protein
MRKLDEIFVRDICEVDEPVRSGSARHAATHVYTVSTADSPTTRDDFSGWHSNDSKYVILSALGAGPHSRHSAGLPPQELRESRQVPHRSSHSPRRGSANSGEFGHDLFTTLTFHGEFGRDLFTTLTFHGEGVLRTGQCRRRFGMSLALTRSLGLQTLLNPNLAGIAPHIPDVGRGSESR